VGAVVGRRVGGRVGYITVGCEGAGVGRVGDGVGGEVGRRVGRGVG
jgi:hypothetical protein